MGPLQTHDHSSHHEHHGASPKESPSLTLDAKGIRRLLHPTLDSPLNLEKGFVVLFLGTDCPGSNTFTEETSLKAAVEHLKKTGLSLIVVPLAWNSKVHWSADENPRATVAGAEEFKGSLLAQLRALDFINFSSSVGTNANLCLAKQFAIKKVPWTTTVRSDGTITSGNVFDTFQVPVSAVKEGIRRDIGCAVNPSPCELSKDVR